MRGSRSTSRGALALVCLALLLGSVQAQDDDGEPVVPIVDVSLWPPEVTTLGAVWTPQVRYNDRIGLGLGAETLLAYRADGAADARLSSLSLYAMRTTKGQWRLNLANDLRWGGDRYYLRCRFDHDDLARQYFGIGPTSSGSDPEVYRPGSTLIYVEGRRSVSRRLSLGPRVEVQRHQVRRATPGGELDGHDVRGTEAGWATGAGVAASYDTRDCLLHACRGIYLQAMTMTFLADVGDHRFQLLNLDLRGYWPIDDRQTLAGQIFYYGVSGEPPFWRLASLGGRTHSRAYSRDRWLDEVLVTGQLEWRRRLGRRLGVVPFAGAAVIDRGPDTMRWSNVRPTLGLGLRVFTSKAKPAVPVRLDLAVGYRHWRVELAVGEAF